MVKALRVLATTKHTNLANLISRIVMGYAREKAEAGFTNTASIYSRIDLFVKTLRLQSMRVGIAGIDTQKERQNLYDSALALLREAVKLADSEKAAEDAHTRMIAMQLANSVSKTMIYILRDYDERDVDQLLEELEKYRDDLKAQLEEQ
jgi:hypothetical protein